MKEMILMGLMSLMGLMVAGATPQTSDADLKAAQNPPPPLQTVDGATLIGGGLSTLATAANWTDLALVVNPAGGTDSSGAYNIMNSSVSMGVSAIATTGGSLANSFAGTINMLSMDDGASPNEFFPYSFSATVNGVVSEVFFDCVTESDSQTLNTNQTAGLTVGSWTVNGGFANTIDVEAANVTALTVPGSMSLFGGGGSAIWNGAFDQLSVDAILASFVSGTNGAGSLVIGGTSSSPSSTGATYEATLVAGGLTVTTN